MEERYWKQFMLTGKVEDYLLYRQEQRKEAANETGNTYKWGIESESDCFDRNGAVRSASW
ncbi:MAG: hypothetical protein KHY31_08645 [Clostridiales bacterium]|nr:hypothetical protein [Clostridiales bacterium]